MQASRARVAPANAARPICANLRQGVGAGNPLCQLRTYRHAVAAALPQVAALDERPLSAERSKVATPGGSRGAAALQRLAAMQLAALQSACRPAPWHGGEHRLQSGPVPAAQVRFTHSLPRTPHHVPDSQPFRRDIVSP